MSRLLLVSPHKNVSFCSHSNSVLAAESNENPSSLHQSAYEYPPEKYSSETILRILLDPSIDPTRICQSWPVTGIVASATFVVDITLLKHPEDVRKDFFGKWIYSGLHPFTFLASVNDNDEVHVERCAVGASGNVFYLRKMHCYHPSRSEFRRMLAFISGKRA